MNKKYFFIIVFVTFSKCIFSQVLPLTSTTWNQGCYYNESVPTISGGQCGKAYTGCYATALAQILKFHNYPLNSWGGNYTNSGTPVQTINFNAQTFNYNLMPNSISASNLQIANLMYVCGVSNDMLYGSTSSNSFFNSLPFLKYFKYSLSIKGIAKFVYPLDIDWINIIKNELNNNRIVFAKGGSHFYLIDGYNLSNQFHINFGFGGLYDGYYDILNVVAGGINYTPTNLLINIKPLATSLEFLSSYDENFIDVPSSGGTSFYKLTSLNNWTITSNQTWCTPEVLSGNAGYHGNLIATISANTTSASRTAIITASNGVTSLLITINQAANSLATSNVDFESNAFKFYPNPVKDIFYLESNIDFENSLDINVFNALGTTIKKIKTIDKLTKIDFSNEQSGIYYVEVKSELKTKHFKILKQ